MHYYPYYNNSHEQLKIGFYCASMSVQNNKEVLALEIML